MHIACRVVFSFQVTLRLISVVPAALLILVAARLSKSVVYAAASRKLEPTTLVHRSMRASLRNMDRLLTSSRYAHAASLSVGFDLADLCEIVTRY